VGEARDVEDQLGRRLVVRDEQRVEVARQHRALKHPIFRVRRKSLLTGLDAAPANPAARPCLLLDLFVECELRRPLRDIERTNVAGSFAADADLLTRERLEIAPIELLAERDLKQALLLSLRSIRRSHFLLLPPLPSPLRWPLLRLPAPPAWPPSRRATFPDSCGRPPSFSCAGRASAAPATAETRCIRGCSGVAPPQAGGLADAAPA